MTQFNGSQTAKLYAVESVIIAQINILKICIVSNNTALHLEVHR